MIILTIITYFMSILACILLMKVDKSFGVYTARAIIVSFIPVLNTVFAVVLLLEQIRFIIANSNNIEKLKMWINE